jgi:hypothetical protein
MKEIVSWDLTLCPLVEVYRRNILLPSSGSKIMPNMEDCVCLFGLLFILVGQGITFIRNVGELLPHYMVPHPRTYYPSISDDFVALSFSFPTPSSCLSQIGH